MPVVRRLDIHGAIWKITGGAHIILGIVFFIFGINIFYKEVLIDHSYIFIISGIAYVLASLLFIYVGIIIFRNNKFLKEVEISVDEFEEDGWQEEETGEQDESNGMLTEVENSVDEFEEDGWLEEDPENGDEPEDGYER